MRNEEYWQWVKFQPSTCELALVRTKGLAFTDQHSFHREIRFDISTNYTPDSTFLTLEFSVPKFWYGHNISLLHDWLGALKHFRKLLQSQLHCRFPKVKTWKVSRLDVCYAWRCPSQDIAQKLLDSLKRLHFPRTKPIIYPDAILFAGHTRSVKLYLKLPEFINHDRKVLLKSNCNFEWINYLEDKASGVLRYEATLRRKFLKQRHINTVEDLTNKFIDVQWSEEFCELNDYVVDSDNEFEWQCFCLINTFALSKYFGSGHRPVMSYNEYHTVAFVDGEYYDAPPYTLGVKDGKTYSYKGGGFTAKKTNHVVELLNYFLNKFLGDNRGMDEAGQVLTKLENKYKSSKAFRLYTFWLFVQRHGSHTAKEKLGRSSFYQSKKDIKEAGCSLVEPPKVRRIDEKFLKNFKLEVPSAYAVNQVDDYRDSDNVINLIPYLDEGKA